MVDYHVLEGSRYEKGNDTPIYAEFYEKAEVTYKLSAGISICGT